MNNDPNLLYAWFSLTHSRLGGILRYRTPQGNIVQLTSLSPTENHCLKWDDVVFVGMVLKNGFVDNLTRGEVDELEEDMPLPEFARKVADIFERETKRMNNSRDPLRWN